MTDSITHYPNMKARTFDRVINFDERSRAFPIRTLVKDRKPRNYTWRMTQEPLDQGPDGACVGFGVTHELIARPSEVQGLDAKFAKERIYWPAQKIDPWDGGSYPGAYPFYEGTDTLSGIKIAKSLGYFEEYRWIFSLEDLILGVGYNGPAVVGTYWMEGMMSPTPCCNQIFATGEILGGHCYVVVAVDIKRKLFQILNSWGKWGENGRAWISFDDMERLLLNDGEASIFLKRKSKV